MLRLAKDDLVPGDSLDPRHCRSDSLLSSPFSTVKSFSYGKLNQEPLNLSVLKLDGNHFDIEVNKTATVAELKQAVEDVFCHTPNKGPGKISWPHVWGQFCLSYDGQKLVTDNDYIISYGIKDGDKLRFVRHVSPKYHFTKSCSKKKIIDSKSLRNHEKNEQNYEEEDSDFDDLETGKLPRKGNKDKDFIKQHGSRFTRPLRGWFSCPNMETSLKMVSKSQANPSRFVIGFRGRLRKIMGFCHRKRCSRTNTWRELLIV